MRDQPTNLRAEYQGAFDEWAQQVSLLQSLTEKPDTGNFGRKEAEERVAAAEAIYRQSRDRLTEVL